VTYSLLLWAHVLVMGYWLGSELVINALTHYIARTTSLSGAERMRLWDFLLDVDQHVRNAMIMSVPLGFSLAGILGLAPIEGWTLVAVWVLSALWFWFMWMVHWRRKAPEGLTFARWDWRLRYVLMALCAGSALWSLATGWPYAALRIAARYRPLRPIERRPPTTPSLRCSCVARPGRLSYCGFSCSSSVPWGP